MTDPWIRYCVVFLFVQNAKLKRKLSVVRIHVCRTVDIEFVSSEAIFYFHVFSCRQLFVDFVG